MTNSIKVKHLLLFVVVSITIVGILFVFQGMPYEITDDYTQVSPISSDCDNLFNQFMATNDNHFQDLAREAGCF